MCKRYANLAFIYAIAAMAFGVFYREFTKFTGFTGDTRLSVIHTHYFLLGMAFFLILMLIEKNFVFSEEKNVGRFILTYNVGLNITTVGFLIRGLVQVLVNNPEKGLDASVSGIAGIGHIVMGVSLGVILFKIRRAVKDK